eukprot:TRINITY_DN20520_c0_g1_i1.p1 TRINITY_DN20520_c0_g1~~TRINITY_DN20520_c0_g1_i1.p1  ORF type:complete len:206 (-),score=31.34 TRINITY_DN20520_c0_g1_i1:125-664(-)
MPKPITADITFSVKTRYDHHSFLRAHQLYRNMSRHCKQYFYGDRVLEERFILTFRELFRVPLTSETPTEKIKHGGARRFADQGDREFELMSYNVHPFQLFTYESNNAELQAMNEAQELRNSGQTPLEDQVLEYFDERIAEETANLSAGESISYDRWTELLGDMIRKYKAETANPGGARD